MLEIIKFIRDYCKTRLTIVENQIKSSAIVVGIFNAVKMYRWLEIWTYVTDFDVPRLVEEWELVEYQGEEVECSLAAQRFASAVRLPTGNKFLTLVEHFFSL